ncbi:hypothetical protein HOT31_gp027 [Microbacterium phage Hendrix]|uniref:Uncharacterized protein n=1 Tax=Microbacterium phage Hendrix TaxID=2182341 RepID=A0A2U8UU67_9CAUD|nr:hypothetical protein HOT31_gp027 [Microbacterium phage Hendrix]AWN07698.1 hypothetical protein PBI_HENDRIX_27 [Microbacterium phage Hendrix]
MMCGTQVPLHGDFLATSGPTLVTCGQCLKSWPTLGREVTR